MTHSRRSGIDRRKEEITISNDRRDNNDRRAANQDMDRITQRFKGVPVFRGLTDAQLKKILTICSMKKVPSNEFIYHAGGEATSMFVLLKGEINIQFASGMSLQNIIPAGVVGEMGIFTGEPRSADVLTVSPCIILSFSKKELFSLFKADTDLYIKILLNIIKDLTQKMRKNNEQIDNLLYRIRSLDIV